jgi:predicted nucleic acid-binding protein
MRTLFVDAVYWIGLLNPRDNLHEQTVSLSRSLDLNQICLVTTEMVLTEFLNAFAERGTALRRAAAELVLRLRQDVKTRIVPQTSPQFDEALQLYRSRHDKEWSHTDCASFRVMEQEGITEALSYDRHFEQAGFKALMRS